MPVEIGPEWDPAAHDYEFTSTPNERLLLSGLIVATAFGLIGIGAAFTVEAAVAAPLTGITVTFELVEGETTVTVIQTWVSNGTALTEGAKIILGVIESGGFATEVVAVGQLLTSFGFRMLTLDGLLALAAYQPPDPNQYRNFGFYMGPYGALYGSPPLAGDPTPPGFPGFLGGGHPWGDLHGHGLFKVCYLGPDNILECFFYQE